MITQRVGRGGIAAHRLAVLALLIVAVSWGAWVMWRGTSGSFAHDSLRASADVCLEVDPAAGSRVDGDAEVHAMQGLMADITRGKAWANAGLRNYPWSVVLGCPGGYVSPPSNVGSNWSQSVGGAPVEAPSQFSVMVYVVGPEEASKLGNQRFGRAAREMMCEGRQCMEVTTALFVSVELLADPGSLRQALEVGLGIDGLEAVPETQ